MRIIAQRIILLYTTRLLPENYTENSCQLFYQCNVKTKYPVYTSVPVLSIAVLFVLLRPGTDVQKLNQKEKKSDSNR